MTALAANGAPAPTDDLLDVSIVLPCRNEERTVAACVREARLWIDGRGLRGEVLVVDNASTDASSAAATQVGASVVHEPRLGYGRALRAGIAAARGVVVIMADADGTYELADLDAFYDPLIRGTDVVVGNRFDHGAPAAMSLFHRIGNAALSRLTHALTGLPVVDVHCGLRSFRRTAMLHVPEWSTGMEYATHMLLHAHETGARIAEASAVLRPAAAGRRSHLRPVPDGVRHLMAITRARRAARHGHAESARVSTRTADTRSRLRLDERA